MYSVSDSLRWSEEAVRVLVKNLDSIRAQLLRELTRMPRRRMGVKDSASMFDARNVHGAFGSPRTPLAVYGNRTVSSTDAMAANLSLIYLLDRIEEGKR